MNNTTGDIGGGGWKDPYLKDQEKKPWENTVADGSTAGLPGHDGTVADGDTAGLPGHEERSIPYNPNPVSKANNAPSWAGNKVGGLEKGLHGEGSQPGAVASNLARKAGGKAGQAVGDAVDSAKLAANYASIAAGNAKAVADIAKDIIKDPRAFLRKNKNLLKYIAMATGLLLAMLGLLLILALLPIFKLVHIANETAKGNYKASLEVLSMVTDKNSVSFMINSANKFSTGSTLTAQASNGAVNAQGTSQNPEDLNTNITDDQKKMFEGFERGKLYEKLSERGVEIKHNGGSKTKDGLANPEAFDLIVGSQNWGNLNSEKAEAYIYNFNRDVLKDHELFMRGSVKSVALQNGRTSLKNDYADPGLDFQKARDTVYGAYFKNTTAPVQKNAEAYDKCRLLNGGADCDSLGALGNVGSEKNRIKSNIDIPVGSVAQGVQSIQIKDVPGPNDPLLVNLLAKVKTTASNGIQDNLFPNNKNQAADEEAQKKDSERLIEAGRRLESAANNGNTVKADYVMKGEQSTQFFIDTAADGGCLLNFECSLINGAVATDRMNIAEQSTNFRRAHLGGLGGVFAASDNNADKECEIIFNDDKPLDNDPTERTATQVDCVNTQLIPDKAQQADKWNSNPFLKKLSEQVRIDDSKSWWDTLKDIVKDILGRLFGIGVDKIRNAPYTAGRTSMDEATARKNAPNTDGAINGEVGIANTGLEVSGSAYDQTDQGANYLASISNFTNNPFNIGAADLDAQQVAQLSQYLDRKEQSRFAIKPLPTRLFSLKESGSLATKMAMLSPSNLGALTYKSYALLKPQNLSSFASVQFAPRAFAASPSLNLAGGKVAGYTVENLQCLEKHTAKQITGDKVCGNIGEQKKNTDVNRPGNTPITVDYAKLYKVAANTSTCYIDPQSGDCGIPGNGTNGSSTQNLSVNSSAKGIEGDIGMNSDTVACAPGTTEVGNIDSNYRGYMKKESGVLKIKLCRIGMEGRGFDPATKQVDEKGAVVNSRVSGAWGALVAASKQAGIKMTSSSSFRYADSCGGVKSATCAGPGGSPHQIGMAIDIAYEGEFRRIVTSFSCANRAKDPRPSYQWMHDNADKFGIYQLANESWHWDLNAGDPVRCDSQDKGGPR